MRPFLTSLATACLVVPRKRAASACEIQSENWIVFFSESVDIVNQLIYALP
jgi:hypothetical protein